MPVAEMLPLSTGKTTSDAPEICSRKLLRSPSWRTMSTFLGGLFVESADPCLVISPSPWARSEPDSRCVLMLRLMS